MGMRALAPETRLRLTAATLLLPLLAFVTATFLVPLGTLVRLSLSSPAGVLAPYLEIVGSAVYRQVLVNTLVLSLTVASIATLASYPTAYMLSRLRGWKQGLALWCLVFPLWISVLVRTFAWILLLERNGPVNRVLASLHLTSSPIEFLFNSTGVIIGMVHVLLPYAVLPVLTSMRGFDERLIAASNSLGASRFATFWRIYLPLTLPGVIAGFTLTFLLAIGFYITPAVLGGPSNMTVAMLIDQFVTERLVWPLAAAASVWLLLVIVLLVAVASRFVNIANAMAAR